MHLWGDVVTLLLVAAVAAALPRSDQWSELTDSSGVQAGGWPGRPGNR